MNAEPADAVLTLLRTADSGAARVKPRGADFAVYQVSKDSALQALGALRSAGGFDTLETIIASDLTGGLNRRGYSYPPGHPARDSAANRGRAGGAGKMELTYMLSSGMAQSRAAVRIALPHTELKLPSAREIYPAADRLEREIYDMFGVVFSGREISRLLTHEGSADFPLRKEYVHSYDILD
ncbi:MAG: NADH-quinone oxidoreductase subunit C [Elusimicrobiales bacterium]|nr:NADH-quinone oxidoreductase subunit C [Elusimicrobiales bacterium]